MVLIIDTSRTSHIGIKIKQDQKTLADKKIAARFKQSERLLSNIYKILKQEGVDLFRVQEIQVVVTGETFTGLRIGVVTANALAYALGVPVRAVDGSGRVRKERIIQERGFHIASPEYNNPPNITTKNKD